MFIRMLLLRIALFGSVLSLTACGGGEDSSVVIEPVAIEPVVIEPVVIEPAEITGRVSFDSVPFNLSTSGLDFTRISSKAARGISVELLDQAGIVLDSTVTNSQGDYLFSVNTNSLVKIRVLAEMIKTSLPSHEVAVTDNTQGNALYVLDGALAMVTGDSTRDLHAASGWDGSAYTEVRAAAPFALLDSVYQAINKVAAVDATIVFPSLELRWSENNNLSSGSWSNGDIGSSFYWRDNNQPVIYVLGKAGSDTDEFDSHVIWHEWAHYFEDQLSRSDSIGGAHGLSDVLDVRVAFSEGFGNAFSGMVSDDSIYRDSFGLGESGGYSFSLEGGSSSDLKGWYSEVSVMQIIYDIYDALDDGADTLSLGFGPIYQMMTGAYKDSASLNSIYTFIANLNMENPEGVAAINTLLNGQNVDSVADEYGSGETRVPSGNLAGSLSVLPLYKDLVVDGVAQTLCSITNFDSFKDGNKLGVASFAKISIAIPGLYQVSVLRNSGISPSDPDFLLYKQGAVISAAESAGDNTEVKNNISLAAGDYVLEVYHYNNIDPSEVTGKGNVCFSVAIVSQ